MKLHQPGVVNKLGKVMAKPLSQLLINPATEDLARLIEIYWCILQGKGAGTGWAFESEIRAAHSTIKTASPILFDVGANSGDWSFVLQKTFPNSRIFLFEPQPDCQKVIQSRQIKNSELIPKAVSSKAGLSQLYVTRISGIASLHERQDSYFMNETFTPIKIETVTLDSIIESYNLSRVDFLKMDIEGHELEALQGAKESLKAGIIKAFSFEFGSGNINSRTFFRDFWNLLHPLKYKIFRILPSSRLLAIQDYYEDCEYFRGVTNYLAVLDEAA